jgi:hypothetical protein
MAVRCLNWLRGKSQISPQTLRYVGPKNAVCLEFIYGEANEEIFGEATAIDSHYTVTDRHKCGDAVARGSLSHPPWGIASLRAKTIQNPITLKMEAVYSSEMSVLSRNTRYYPKMTFVSVAFSPKGSYTDWATAAVWIILVSAFAKTWCREVSVANLMVKCGWNLFDKLINFNDLIG